MVNEDAALLNRHVTQVTPPHFSAAVYSSKIITYANWVVDRNNVICQSRTSNDIRANSGEYYRSRPILNHVAGFRRCKRKVKVKRKGDLWILATHHDKL